MTITGNRATKTLTGISRPTITWWVYVQATDGRTYTTPKVTEEHPCYANPP
jgi:hypothetical protein